MAGSYLHCVDDDGRLREPEELGLENGGDVYEAVEEMYGMIWYLAHQLGDTDSVDNVEIARQNYRIGLRLAPQG